MTDPTDSVASSADEVNHHHIATSVSVDRLVLPIARDHLPADKVTVYPIGDFDPDEPVEDLVRTLGGMLGYPTEVTDPITSFDDAYITAYKAFTGCLDHGGRHWVNIEGVEDSRGHAFILAANTLQQECPGKRTDIRLYSVGDDGEPVMVPTVPSDEPEGIAVSILAHLSDNEPPNSVSELARRLADGELDESLRSRIQYNVAELEKSGYIIRNGGGYQKRPELSPAGRLWVETHPEVVE